MNSNDIPKLKSFIDLVTHNPNILHAPELDFFKQYLIKLNATIPELTTSSSQPHSAHSCCDHGHGHHHEPRVHGEEEDHEEEEKEEEEEEEIPLFADDMSSQDMGDRDKEITEEANEKAAEFKQKAVDAQNEGNIDEAIVQYTNAIKEAPSAHLYANRAQLFLQLNKPNSAIRDCSEALFINSDSAKAYKIRGKAYKALCQWEESAKDLRLGNKLDWEESSYEIQKLVEEKLAQVKEKRKKFQKKAKKGGNIPDPQSIPGLFPEILEYLQDPEMGPIIQEIMQNPDAIQKYRSNPKVMELINKISSLSSQQ